MRLTERWGLQANSGWQACEPQRLPVSVSPGLSFLCEYWVPTSDPTPIKKCFLAESSPALCLMYFQMNEYFSFKVILKSRL